MRPFSDWIPRTNEEYREVQRKGMQVWALALKAAGIIDYVIMAPHSLHDMSPSGLEHHYPLDLSCAL